MAEDESETRTRLQRETALKEASTLFNKKVRNLNKVVRSIHLATARSQPDSQELEHYSSQYQSFLDQISEVYDGL